MKSLIKDVDYLKPDVRVFVIKLQGILCQSILEDPEHPGDDNDY